MLIHALFSTFFFIASVAAQNIEYDGIVQISLEHDLSGLEQPHFTERGNVTISSLRLGTSNVLQKVSADDIRKIQTLAAQNKFYKLKATVFNNDGPTTFVSFIKACMLAEAELNDIITITLDYTGRIITVIESIASTSTCQGAQVGLDKLKEFTTSVFVRHTYAGPGPDVATYIQKLENERLAKERGEVKDNRSFLAKYWMYIIPVVVIMVLSSAANPEGAAGATGGR